MTRSPSAPASISVIIPVYQAERFVGDALAAVFAQTRSPAEVILVDDGSTDGSLAAIDDALAAHPRTLSKVSVISQSNRGPSAARNSGLAASTGEIVAFHDADDRAVPTWLELLAGRIDADDGLACAIGTQVIEVEPGTPLPVWLDHVVDIGLAGSRPSQLYAQMCPVIRRSALDIVGPYDETLRAGEDTDLILRLIDAGLRVEFTEDVVLRRRVHATSLTQDAEAFRRAQFGVLARRIHRKQAAR